MEEHLVQQKAALLRKVDLFSRLQESEIEIVSRNSNFAAYRRGTSIFREGDLSTQLFIVLEGEVLVTRHLPGDNDVLLAQYIPGDFFGELDLFENTPRDASAVTIQDTVLLTFPMDGMTLAEVLEKYPKISAVILYKLLGMISTRLRNTHRLMKEKAPWIASLRRELFTDKLTGLFNEKFLLEEFKLQLPRYGPHTALIMIKPDGFKTINDTHGHEAGDRILMILSIFIQSVMGISDIAIRYRGDEFAAVLPGRSREEAIEIAKEIGKSIYEIDTSSITGDISFRLLVSIGIAVYPEQADSSSNLIRLAHDRMYTARARGGNRIVLSDGDHRQCDAGEE